MQLVLLVYCVCHLSLLEGPKVMAGTYTTDFHNPENPISEGGNWINGKTNGLDWSDVQTIPGLTTPGLAIGTQVGNELNNSNYNDSTALLTGTWGSNQTASATVYATNQRNDVFEEVEIRLRSSLSAHSCTGYEINFSLKADTNQTYCQIVRWLGPNGIEGIGFEYLAGEHYNGLPFTLHTGDVVTATITNSTITAYINGIQYLQATDPNAYSSGSPGMGFYIGGATGVNGDYGFTSYTATDGIEPLGGSIVLATTENTAVTVSSNKLVKVASDADGYALTITALNSPTNAGATTALTNNANIVYTPASGFTGTDSFTYVVSDPFGAEATNTVNVTVNALNVSASLANITTLPDGTMQIIASGYPGTNYWIQATTNMSTTPWTTIATNAALLNGLILFTDLCAPDYLMRYYRLAVPTNN